MCQIPLGGNGICIEFLYEDSEKWEVLFARRTRRIYSVLVEYFRARRFVVSILASRPPKGNIVRVWVMVIGGRVFVLDVTRVGLSV